MSTPAWIVWCSCSPWRAVCLDMCACVSSCAKSVYACRRVFEVERGGVEQVPRYRFPAMSLKRAVKSLQQIPYIHLCQSTRHTLGVYTGGNTIYLMLHCPHVQSPPPHTGDSQCLTSISYSEQAGRQAGECREWTPSCCKSAFKHPAKCNLERVNKRPSHYTAQDICFYLFWNLQLIFVPPPRWCMQMVN